MGKWINKMWHDGILVTNNVAKWMNLKNMKFSG